MNRLVLVMLLAAVPAFADPPSRRGDQDAAFRDRQQGQVRPLRDIEEGLVPRMRDRGADYIGAEYDRQVTRYRLKFMRQGSVIWVDVDGRTGRTLGRAGDD